ncbi:aquaporin [Lactarius akahatsu]|uniref:Aquaporin n=1 Tax=Lactarius akahatsu TaxID=416441 RepID=A0AAD4QCJ3_9AGAM|nr:aquaporin [Lactarius akahatsu]
MPSHHELVGKTYGSMQDYYTRFPNHWAQVREYIRAPAAEMLGVMILVLFGDGVVCQVSLASNPKVTPAPAGDWLSVNTAWGIGAALGVWISAGVSGGHINPVVTVCAALFRGFPWKRVPVYIFSQVLGAYLAALIVYANYFHAIDIVEGKGIRTVPGTAGYFTPYPPPYMTAANCFFDEFICSFLLVITVWIVTDPKNGPTSIGMLAIAVYFVVVGIGASFGLQTGYMVNPARDLGPRLMTWTVGYGREVFNFRSQYWLWCTLLGPMAGGITATFMYDCLIYQGTDSIINKPCAAARQYLSAPSKKDDAATLTSATSAMDAV